MKYYYFAFYIFYKFYKDRKDPIAALSASMVIGLLITVNVIFINGLYLLGSDPHPIRINYYFPFIPGIVIQILNYIFLISNEKYLVIIDNYKELFNTWNKNYLILYILISFFLTFVMIALADMRH